MVAGSSQSTARRFRRDGMEQLRIRTTAHRCVIYCANGNEEMDLIRVVCKCKLIYDFCMFL